jgi:translation elongation factor EF-G
MEFWRDTSYILSGNSVSYLESICDRLRGEYHCAINVSPIKVVLLETIRKQTEAEGKYIRQTGGSGNYGHCKLRIDRPDNDDDGGSPLVEVELAASVNPVRTVDRDCALTLLLFNGRRVEVDEGFNDETLRRLVAVLERF